MQLVAASFGWPFRGAWRSRWAIGFVAILVLPLTFIIVLGYAISAIRAAALNPAQGPPPWMLSARLLVDGFWTTLVLLLITAPFALVFSPLAGIIDQAHLWYVSDWVQSQVYAHLAAISILALPWGFLLLLLLPHATRRYAMTGRPADLFDFAASVREVAHDFVTWNLVAAAMVTAWALGLACIGLLCIGLLPGMFYAILVSAHAAAALHAQVENPSTG